MANKPIVEIGIDDAKWKTFQASFEKYQTALKKMPQLWGQTEGAVSGMAEGFIGMTAAIFAQHELSQKQTKEIDKQKNIYNQIGRTLKDMRGSAASIAKDIEKTTLRILKWSSVAVGGLVGGGLWGIDRLAQSVAGNRQLALSTGSGYGGSQAALAQFGQYFNVAGVLSNIKGVTGSGIGSWGYAGEAQQLSREGMSTDEILRKMLPEMVAEFKRNPTQLGMDTSNMSPLIGFGDMTTFANLSPEEQADRLSGASADARRLDLSPDIQRKWADLDKTLGESGRILETDFIKALTNAAPQIERLSKAVIDIADTYLPKLGSALDSVTAWLGRHFGVSEGGGAATGNDLSYGQVQGALKGSSVSLDLLSKLEGGTTGQANAAGAIGRYQIKQGTADQYKIKDNLWTAEGNEAAAAKLLAVYSKMYGGNAAEMLVAYNQGSGWGDALRATNDDVSLLPAEAKAYLRKAAKLTGAGTGASTAAAGNGSNPPTRSIYGTDPFGSAGRVDLNLTVSNQTGSGIAINASQLPS